MKTTPLGVIQESLLIDTSFPKQESPGGWGGGSVEGSQGI